MLRSAVLGALIAASWTSTADACTAIIIGKSATTDGSVMTTHNNDCTDCDLRIVRVPARDYEKTNSTCPVWPCKFSFPRFLSEDESRGAAYSLEETKKHNVEGDFAFSSPFMYIDQVEHTYAYIDGTYGLVNEHGLAMGESTCGAKLVSYGYPRGDAMFDVSALGRLALERCKTARCAINLMGEMAEKYGYYGANDPVEEGMGMYEEAGEAFTIIDAEGEAWVFHILPDDTGKSAVWAAQRVPDDSIAVVSNSFIIKEMKFDDPDNFLFSKNVVDVAVRAGFWEKDSKKTFDFSVAYSPDGLDGPSWGARRTWRVFDLVAPSLKIDPDTKTPLPFSIKTERKISLNDIQSYARDRFEGSKYDLSIGPASGPWGNPNRYDQSGRIEYWGGYFERAISLHRTQYSFVAQARPWMKGKAATVLWHAHHSPHSSLFVPIYCTTQKLDKSYEYGHLFRLERSSAWWAYAAVNNWAETKYAFMSQDISALQKKLENGAQEDVTNLDKQLQSEDGKKIAELTTHYTVKTSKDSLDTWWNLFDFLFTKYRDGARLESFTPPVNTMPLFYPSWWLGEVGYYNNGPQLPSKSWKAPPVQPPPHPDAKPWVLADVNSEIVAEANKIAAGGKRRIPKGAKNAVLYDQGSVQNIRQSVAGLNLADASAAAPAAVAAVDETKYIPVTVETSAVSTLGIFSVSVMMMLAFVAGRQFEKRKNYEPLGN